MTGIGHSGMMKQNQKMRITDPYLKERVKLSGEQRSGGGWFIGLILLGILVGGGYYFYPQIQSYTKPMVEQIQQQIAKLTAKDETSKPIDTASNENNTPPPVTTSEITQPTTETVEIAENSETLAPVEIVTAEQETQSEKTVTSLPEVAEREKTPLKDVPLTTALPHETPQDVLAKPAPPPQQAEAETEEVKKVTAEIEELVSKANQQLRRTRLTKPEGDNAYETYQALLELDTEKANEILTSIVDLYQQEAQNNLKEGWIAYPVNRNAMLTYQRLQEIAPDHEGTKNLLKDILLALKARVDMHLERNNIFEPANDNAYINAGLMYSAAPQHEITQASLATVEQRMLEIADRQIAQKKFTTPEDDSAYKTYQTMLKMNPNSVKAKQAVQALATRYYDLALKRKRQGRETAALSLIERGLGIDPEHEKLNRLKQQLEN